MSPFQLAIFDLDGTLIDSRADIAAALNAALAESGLPPHPAEEVQAMIGDGVGMLVRRALAPDHLGEADRIAARFREHYGRRLVVETRPYPGIPELVERAAAAGVRLAIATNKPTRFALEIVRELGLAPHFTCVVGEGDGVPRKPDPTMVETVLSRAGAPRERTLYVGDSLVDAQTARNAHLPLALVTWGYTPRGALDSARPDWLCDRAAELAAILTGSGATFT